MDMDMYMDMDMCVATGSVCGSVLCVSVGEFRRSRPVMSSSYSSYSSPANPSFRASYLDWIGAEFVGGDVYQSLARREREVT